VRRHGSFFHALVVAGAGLSATDCGGIANEEGGAANGGGSRNAGGAGFDAGTSSTGGGGASGYGGVSGSGGAAGSGGTAGSGATGFGGGLFGGAPGTGGATSITDAGLHDAPTLAQWDCAVSQNGAFCSYGAYAGQSHSLLQLTAPCPVNPSLPRTPQDCAPGEWFDCAIASYRGSEPILVACHCWAPSDAGCADTSSCIQPVCQGITRACGCAYPVILK
jgi:hypothetical protein